MLIVSWLWLSVVQLWSSQRSWKLCLFTWIWRSTTTTTFKKTICVQTACLIKTDEEEGLAMNSYSYSADCQMQTLFSKRDSYAICGNSNLKIYTRHSWWIPSLNSEVVSGAQCQVSHKSSTLKFVSQAIEVQAEVNCLEFDFKFKSTQNFQVSDIFWM